MYQAARRKRDCVRSTGILPVSSMGAGSQTRCTAFGVPVPPMTVPETHGQDARATEPPDGGTPDESRETNPIAVGANEGGTPKGGKARKQSCETNPIREPDSAPKKTPAEPPRPRMYPNTAKEMTYDFGLRRWVWTGYALAGKDSKPADSGRHP